MLLLIVPGREARWDSRSLSLPVRSSNCHSTSDFGGQEDASGPSIRRTKNSSTGNRPMIVNRGNYVCMSGQEQNTGTHSREYYFNVARVRWTGRGAWWGAGHVARDTRLGEIRCLGKRQRGNSLAKIFTQASMERFQQLLSFFFTRNRSFLPKLSRYIYIYIYRSCVCIDSGIILLFTIVYYLVVKMNVTLHLI